MRSLKGGLTLLLRDRKMRLVEELQGELAVQAVGHVLPISRETIPRMNQPSTKETSFFLLSIQLAAVSAGGPDSPVWVGLVCVRTYAGQGQLRRDQTKMIGHQWSHVDDGCNSIRIMMLMAMIPATSCPCDTSAGLLLRLRSLQMTGVAGYHHLTPPTQHTVAFRSMSNFATSRIKTSCLSR